MSIEAIVLAAGTSSRMGKANKLLLPVNGRLMIEHVVDQLLVSAVDRIIVVTGHEEDVVKKVLTDKEVHFAFNPNYPTGMTGSIQTGVKVLNKETKAFLVCLSDMPFIQAANYDLIINTYWASKKDIHFPIIVPIKNGRKGNPVLFDAHYQSAILAHTQPEGCKEILMEHQESLVQLEVDSDVFFRDIDTPDAYHKL